MHIFQMRTKELKMHKHTNSNSSNEDAEVATASHKQHQRRRRRCWITVIFLFTTYFFHTLFFPRFYCASVVLPICECANLTAATAVATQNMCVECFFLICFTAPCAFISFLQFLLYFYYFDLFFLSLSLILSFLCASVHVMFFLLLRSTRRSCICVCYFLFVIDVVSAGAVADIIIDDFFLFLSIPILLDWHHV